MMAVEHIFPGVFFCIHEFFNNSSYSFHLIQTMRKKASTSSGENRSEFWNSCRSNHFSAFVLECVVVAKLSWISVSVILEQLLTLDTQKLQVHFPSTVRNFHSARIRIHCIFEPNRWNLSWHRPHHNERIKQIWIMSCLIYLWLTETTCHSDERFSLCFPNNWNDMQTTCTLTQYDVIQPKPD